MSLILRGSGRPGVADDAERDQQVTISRYRVTYRRADGRNAPGRRCALCLRRRGDVHRPGRWRRPPDSSSCGTRPRGKRLSRGSNGDPDHPTIAEVTFYGHDQAGNEVSVTGTSRSISVTSEIPRRHAMITCVVRYIAPLVALALMPSVATGCTVQKQTAPGAVWAVELGLVGVRWRRRRRCCRVMALGVGDHHQRAAMRTASRNVQRLVRPARCRRRSRAASRHGAQRARHVGTSRPVVNVGSRRSTICVRRSRPTADNESPTVRDWPVAAGHCRVARSSRSSPTGGGASVDRDVRRQHVDGGRRLRRRLHL